MQKKISDGSKIIAAIVIIMATIAIINGQIEKNNLEKNYSISKGQIIKLQSGGVPGGLKFTFPEHEGNHDPMMNIAFPQCRNLIWNRMKELQTRRFPVVYEIGNPENAKILIYRRDYEKFKIDIPAELKDIVDELSSCFD